MSEHSLSSDQIATPRTDAAKFTARERYCIYPGKDELVYADFARAQERRIAELESHNATLELSNARLRAKIGGRRGEIA